MAGRNTYSTVIAGVTKVMATQYNPLVTEVAKLALSTPHAEFVTLTTASGNITLTDASEPLQSINCNGAARSVTLPAVAATNHPFRIINRTASIYTVTVKNAGGVVIALVPHGKSVSVFSDGTNGWYVAEVGQANDGWIGTNWANPTRVSGTEFTVDQDVTAELKLGDRLRYTDTTTKYASVIGVTFSAGKTSIVITGGSDFSLVGTPSAIYYSKSEGAIGWPIEFNWTPIWNNLVAGNGTYTAAKFTVLPSRIKGRVEFVWGSTTSIGAAISLSLPVNTSIAHAFVPAGNVALIDVSAFLYHGSILLTSGVLSIRCLVQNGTTGYYGYTYVTATAPHTWTTGDIITLTFEYPW